MLLKTKGIVLRSFKYSETSLISEIFTEEKGLKKYIISGVRSQKAKISANLLQVMSILDLVAYEREGKELQRVKEIKPAYVYQHLPFDIRRSSVGLFITEVAQKTLRQSGENRDLFQYLHDTYVHLDQSPHSVANVHLYFMLRLSRYLGFIPDGQYEEETPYFDLQEGTFLGNSAAKYALSEAQSILLDQLLDSNLQTIHHISIDRTTRSALLRKLIQYYQLHIENFPAISAHLILKDVLE